MYLLLFYGIQTGWLWHDIPCCWQGCIAPLLLSSPMWWVPLQHSVSAPSCSAPGQQASKRMSWTFWSFLASDHLPIPAGNMFTECFRMHKGKVCHERTNQFLQLIDWSVSMIFRMTGVNALKTGRRRIRRNRLVSKWDKHRHVARGAWGPWPLHEHFSLH